MSWSPDLFIGELRPLPDSVRVVRGGEVTRYMRRSDDRVAERGECRNKSNVTDAYGQSRFVCSSCGAWMDSRMLWSPAYPNGESPFVKDCKLNYCPNCGRRVVKEDK